MMEVFFAMLETFRWNVIETEETFGSLPGYAPRTVS